MTDDTIFELERFIKDVQSDLWYDFHNALHYAANGFWSADAENKLNRIIRCIKVVGPTPWGEVQIPLLSSGVYQAVLRKLEVEVPEIDLTGTKNHQRFPAVWAKSIERIEEFELEEDDD